MKVLALVLVTASSVAYAEPSAQDLQAQGEQLAKDGRFSEAIDAFKAADKQQPTASHACLIALAYTRRELWPQAEIFLARCHERATPADPLPDWVPVAEQQIAERLTTANAAPVTIQVTPATAELAVSSFAPDETFSPRTIHLPPGHHVIIATAPGFETARKEVDVETKNAQTVRIDLVPVAQQKPVPLHDVPVVPAQEHHSSFGKKLVIGGAVLVGAGLVTYGWMGYEWSQLRTQDQAQWDAHDSNYSLSRGVTIGLWAVGGAALVTGLLWPSSPERPAVAVMPANGGGMVSVGWSR